MTYTNGETKLYGLIGRPAAHSLSPGIHSCFYERHGLNAKYLAFELQGGLREALAGAHSLGVLGLNITMPFKAEAVDYLAGFGDNYASFSQSCNCLKWGEAGYVGYNTDVYGIMKTAESLGVSKGSALIIGAGSTAASAAAALCEAGMTELYIVNRTYERAESLARKVSVELGVNCGAVFPEELARLQGLELAVQCSSVGMGSDVSAPISELGFLENTRAVIDMIYHPRETRLLREARGLGIACANGLPCLVWQAARSFEIWTGRQIPETVLNETIIDLNNRL